MLRHPAKRRTAVVTLLIAGAFLIWSATAGGVGYLLLAVGAGLEIAGLTLGHRP